MQRKPIPPELAATLAGKAQAGGPASMQGRPIPPELAAALAGKAQAGGPMSMQGRPIPPELAAALAGTPPRPSALATPGMPGFPPAPRGAGISSAPGFPPHQLASSTSPFQAGAINHPVPFGSTPPWEGNGTVPFGSTPPREGNGTVPFGSTPSQGRSLKRRSDEGAIARNTGREANGAKALEGNGTVPFGAYPTLAGNDHPVAARHPSTGGEFTGDAQPIPLPWRGGPEGDGVVDTAAIPDSPRMTKPRAEEAMATLRKYRSHKQHLENRLIENDKWFRLHHWEMIPSAPPEPYQKSAWLLNCILNKHADAIDNFPQANVLPREESDKGTASILSQVLPVLLDQNDFEGVYSDAWWQKLQSGTAVYGVFWNPRKLNGLGDIEIRFVDLINLYWEPGVRDIQNSQNLFHVELQNNDALVARYPKLSGKLTGSAFPLAEYDKDDPPDLSKKSLVVDWYYKVQSGSREVVHFCKLCGGEVLYASEDDPQCAEAGFYAHGQYPFVFDALFPVKESPAGFGYVDLMKDTQERIDLLGSSIVKNARMRAMKRFFIRNSGSVNEQEFADWSKELVHTEGALDEASVREIRIDPIGGDVMNAYNAMIEELKETSGNRDFSQGGVTGGVTAASAIAALQEAGSKLSRDMLKASYRSYTQVCRLVIELIRQFYDLPRTFRIVGEAGQAHVSFDNGDMMMKNQGQDPENPISSRLPIFDIDVKPQKNNPYSKVAQNEMAMEFFRMGFFNPQMSDQALSCIEMMDFDGKDALMQRIGENGTLQKQVAQLQQQMGQMAAQMQGAMAGGGGPGGPGAMPGGPEPGAMAGLGGPGGPGPGAMTGLGGPGPGAMAGLGGPGPGGMAGLGGPGAGAMAGLGGPAGGGGFGGGGGGGGQCLLGLPLKGLVPLESLSREENNCHLGARAIPLPWRGGA